MEWDRTETQRELKNKLITYDTAAAINLGEDAVAGLFRSEDRQFHSFLPMIGREFYIRGCSSFQELLLSAILVASAAEYWSEGGLPM